LRERLEEQVRDLYRVLPAVKVPVIVADDSKLQRLRLRPEERFLLNRLSAQMDVGSLIMISSMNERETLKDAQEIVCTPASSLYDEPAPGGAAMLIERILCYRFSPSRRGSVARGGYARARARRGADAHVRLSNRRGYVLDFVYTEAPERVAQVIEAAEREPRAWDQRRKARSGEGTPEQVVTRLAGQRDPARRREARSGRHGHARSLRLTHFLHRLGAERVIRGGACSVIHRKLPGAIAAPAR